MRWSSVGDWASVAFDSATLASSSVDCSMALIHNYVSGVQLLRSRDNLGQNSAFLLLPHGNSVPAHPDFD